MVILSLYFSCSSTKPGISALQGPHHVAQKLSNTTLPLNDDNSTSLPSRFFNLKSKFAGFASAMHAGVSAPATSCDAAGVTDAGAAAGAGSSSCAWNTNGMLIASSATAVTTTAIMRILELAFGRSLEVASERLSSIPLFCLILKIRRHARETLARAAARYQHVGPIRLRPDDLLVTEQRQFRRGSRQAGDDEQRQRLAVQPVHDVGRASVAVQTAP